MSELITKETVQTIIKGSEGIAELLIGLTILVVIFFIYYRREF